MTEGRIVELGSREVSLRRQAINLADRTFVYGRNLDTSLVLRYPAGFQRSLGGRIVTVIDDSEQNVLSMACVRNFQLNRDGRQYTGCMIGLVCSAPEQRRQGLATRLLEAIVENARHLGTDIAVLWSGHRDFYRSRDWAQRSSGLFGKLALPHDDRAPTEGLDQLSTRTVRRLEKLRPADSRILPRRPLPLWRTLPLPADSIELCIQEDAYAIVGRSQDTTAYLFELGGNASIWPKLWPSVVGTADNLFANATEATQSAEWLMSMGAQLIPQTLAFWQFLSPRSAALRAATPNIPFFDRL
jgi:GNAT superfamily N-acetyltransferase